MTKEPEEPSQLSVLAHRALGHAAFRYLFGVAMAATAFGVRLFLAPWTGKGAPFVLFFGAMLVTTLVAGVGPGLLVLLISLPVAAATFAVPGGATIGQAAFQAVLYCIDGLVILELTHLAQQARRRLQRANHDLGEAAARLQDSETRTRQIVELAPDAYFQADLEARFVDVNQAACSLLGYERNELLGKRILDIIPPEDARRLEVTRTDLLMPGVVHVGEWTQVRKDGTHVPVEVSSNILPGGRWQAFVRDITKRTQAVEALRQSELKFRRLVETMPDSVFIHQGGRIVYANRSFYSLLGYSDERALVGRSIQELLTPDSLKIVQERIERIQETGGSAPPRQVTLLRCDGMPTVVETVGVGIPFEGAPAIVVVARDLTERVRAEQERDRTESEQRTLAEVGVALAASLDYEQTLATVARIAVRDFADWCVVEVMEEPHAPRRLEVASAEPANARIADQLQHFRLDRARPYLTKGVVDSREPLLVPNLTPEDLEAVAQSPDHLHLLQAIAPRSLISIPLSFRQELLGTLTFVSSKPSRRYGPANLKFALAIAERASLAIESARRYRAALQATGMRDQVLSVVAHDLRNPLSTIFLHASALQRPKPHPERRKQQHKETIERAARRMDRLIHDLLDVAAMEAGQLKVDKVLLSPGELVSEAVDMQRALATASSIDLVLEAAADVPQILGDRDRLLQVFENLIGNALKFTPAGGQVRVGVARSESGALFWVADTGRGMTPEDLKRIFERFWQASARTGRLGAGLGLPITKGIVEAHGGHIWAESTPGQGSRFIFAIPEAPLLDSRSVDVLH